MRVINKIFSKQLKKKDLVEVVGNDDPLAGAGEKPGDEDAPVENGAGKSKKGRKPARKSKKNKSVSVKISRKKVKKSNAALAPGPEENGEYEVSSNEN